MVNTSEKKLIIEIDHPCPKEYLMDLREALIKVMQDRELSETTQLKEFQETNVTLLELLKQTMKLEK